MTDLSRRNFLKGGAAVVAGAAVTGFGTAAEAQTNRTINEYGTAITLQFKNRDMVVAIMENDPDAFHNLFQDGMRRRSKAKGTDAPNDSGFEKDVNAEIYREKLPRAISSAAGLPANTRWKDVITGINTQENTKNHRGTPSRADQINLMIRGENGKPMSELRGYVTAIGYNCYENLAYIGGKRVSEAATRSHVGAPSCG